MDYDASVNNTAVKNVLSLDSEVRDAKLPVRTFVIMELIFIYDVIK